MPLNLTKKFLKLEEKIVRNIPLNDETLYEERPAYYSVNNPEYFNQAKSQIILLLDKIIAENPDALTNKLTEFKNKLIKLKTIGDNYNQTDVTPLLTNLKQRLESLYYYNRHLLKNLQESQFADLTLNACHQGAYSNALMFIDRVTACSCINTHLLSAKRELILQQAANYLATINVQLGNQIHVANSLYNYVASDYNMLPIQDTRAPQLAFQNLNDFAKELKQNFTASALLNFVERSFVIPAEYDYQQLENILPKNLFNHWASALYNTKGQAPDIARTGRLLLIVILQELGFIEGVINEIIVDSDHPDYQRKIYQIDNDVFIEEYIEDQILCGLRAMVRVCNNTKEDNELLLRYYDQLKEGRFSPSMGARLPLSVLLKLIHVPQASGWAFAATLTLATTQDDKSRLIASLCQSDKDCSGIMALAHNAPELVNSALALATTQDHKSKFVSALCQANSDNWTGIKVLAQHTPKSVNAALALATTEEDRSKFIMALCHVDNNNWTGIGVLGYYAPKSVNRALALATTKEDKAKLVAALCQVDKLQNWTGLKVLGCYAPTSVNAALALATTQEDKSKFVAALCQVNNKGQTGLRTLLYHTPNTITAALDIATTKQDKSKFLAILCQVESKGKTRLKFLLDNHPESIRAILALATTEEDKLKITAALSQDDRSKIIATLCQVGDKGWTELRVLAQGFPESVSAALALATTEEDKSKFVAALCHVDKQGWTGLKALLCYSPNTITAALAIATTKQDKSKLLATLCQVDNEGKTGLKVLLDDYPASINAALALATTAEDQSMLTAALSQDDKSKVVTTLCQINDKGKTGLKALACYAPAAVNAALALAITKEDKEKLVMALCRVGNEGWTGLK
ncbi:hypothetical protein, partial [Piscirickettsia salmonis]